MKLSKRLQAVASFVEKGSHIADIGTDHGYVPIWLIQEGRASRVIAMDVRSGPLSRAEVHIKENHMEDQIETRLSNGLEQLKIGEVDTVIIAGMGGSLILQILEEAAHIRHTIKRFILSPQSDLNKFRHQLEQLNLHIQQEHMLEEEGKYYTIMVATQGFEKYERESMYTYGKHLILQKDVTLKQFLEKEYTQLCGIAENLVGKDSLAMKARMDELKEEIRQNREAYDEM